MSKAQQIKKLEQHLLDSKICQELAEQATQLVIGDGSLDTEIVFIGEAPGKQEDIQGKPFVGASGKFLDDMLKSIQLRREDVYITNIVKYRPPGNRDPLPNEKEAMLPYLKKQIEIIKPKLIITLGRHSGMEFLPGFKISQDHGKIFAVPTSDGGKWHILPLYHPAAALYNGSMREVLLDDFAKIPAVLAKLS